MKLTVLGLPIGNIEDISTRALKRLEETRFLICEDSRMFSNLWTKLVSNGVAQKFEGKIKFVNDFNEHRVLPRLLAEMDILEEAVLVSDAGMPLISDPGFKMVREGIDRGWEIDVIPGPTAESAALAVSGLPTDKYIFLGFLPKKEGKRKEMLLRTKEMNLLMNFSIVIYESPVRLEKIFLEMVEIFGMETGVCLSLDLTKVSQKIFRGTLAELSEFLKGKKMKGEATIVVSLA